MRFTKSAGKKSLAASTVTLLGLTLFAGAAGAQTVTPLGSGSSDDLVAPPAPACAADALTLIPQVSFTTVGVPIDAQRLGVGPGLVETFEIEDFPELDAGVIEITEIITYDAHTGRSGWPAQDNERVAIEFLLDGDVVVTTEFTPDVADSVNSAWAETNLGEYTLPDGADAANIIHFGEANNTDSVVVASLCAEFTEGAAESTAGTTADAEEDDDVADEEEDDAADADDDDTELTLAELIERSIDPDAQTAAAEGVNGVELAATGANEIAFGIIAFGVILFGIAMKVQGTDPEELTY